MCVTAPSLEQQLLPLSTDNAASLRQMQRFADSDGHIVASGASSDHETNYDTISSGHRRKVIIDGIFNRSVS